MYSYLFPLGFVNACWHTTMPVGIVSGSWTGTRWPPSHVANGLPVAPSAEPCPRSRLHAFRSRMVSHCAFWNVGRGHGRETGCIRELQRASPCRCPMGSMRPGCSEDGWSWGKGALPVRSSCVGFSLLSSHLCNRGFCSVTCWNTGFSPASFVFLNEAVCGYSVRFPTQSQRQRVLRAKLHCEGQLGSELWSMLESMCIAAVLPLTLPAFPGLIFPQLSVRSAVATLSGDWN